MSISVCFSRLFRGICGSAPDEEIDSVDSKEKQIGSIAMRALRESRSGHVVTEADIVARFSSETLEIEHGPLPIVAFRMIRYNAGIFDHPEDQPYEDGTIDK